MSAPSVSAVSSPRSLTGALRRAGGALALAVGLAVGIGVLLTAVLPSRQAPWTAFAINTTYAFCISLCIQGLDEAGRRVLTRLQGHRTDEAQRQHHWPGWRWYAPWLVVASVLGYLLGGLTADALTGQRHIRSLLSGELRPLVFMAALTLMVSALSAIALIARARADSAQLRARQVEREAAEHQLRLLESQLEPHMLFNTLANLRVLIAEDPPAAQAMLDRLIAFLRGTLGASLARTQPLEAEFDRLEDYLALMAVRMGPRLQCDFELPAALRDHPFPPLLLQPLVENAIRHGLEPAVAGGRLSVRAGQEGGQLVVTVDDTGLGLGDTVDGRPAGPSAGMGAGFGTQQVRQRLATLHGTAASLTIEPGPHGVGTRARIRLPLQAPAADFAMPRFAAHRHASAPASREPPPRAS